MVNGKKCMIDEVTGEVFDSYNLQLQNKNGETNTDLSDRASGKSIIIVQKDIRTDKAEYDELLDHISFGIYLFQDKYSNKTFGE